MVQRCGSETIDARRLTAMSLAMTKVTRELDVRRALLRYASDLRVCFFGATSRDFIAVRSTSSSVPDRRRLAAEIAELEDDWSCLASARDHARRALGALRQDS